MHTCKVSVRDLVEFILRSGDIVSSSTGIRDTDAMQEGTRIHKKLQKQMGSQYHAEVPLKYTSSVCYDNLSFAISVEGRADGIFPKSSHSKKACQILPAFRRDPPRNRGRAYPSDNPMPHYNS